jgi:hypothetical protein
VNENAVMCLICATTPQISKVNIGRHMAKHDIDVKGWLSVKDGNLLKKSKNEDYVEEHLLFTKACLAKHAGQQGDGHADNTQCHNAEFDEDASCPDQDKDAGPSNAESAIAEIEKGVNLWKPAFVHVDHLGNVAQPLKVAFALPQEGILWSDTVLGKIEQPGVEAKHSFNTPSPKARAKKSLVANTASIGLEENPKTPQEPHLGQLGTNPTGTSFGLSPLRQTLSSLVDVLKKRKPGKS